MEATTRPTIGNGKICYLMIPAEDIAVSAEFYRLSFGWNIRVNSDGHTAFDDAVGEVSGTWVTGRKPSTDPGILVYIMVDSVAEAIEKVIANGGALVKPIGVDPGEITAWIADPAGNVFGLYQEPSQSV